MRKQKLFPFLSNDISNIGITRSFFSYLYRKILENRLKNEIRQLTNSSISNDGSKMNVQVNISEIKRPELDAALVGSNIAHQLQKKVSYRRVVNKVIQSTMRMGAEGIRINIAGRLGGAEIAKIGRAHV